MVAKVDCDLCVACGACVDECPSEAITLEDCAKVNAELCTDCGTCVDNCPSDAIVIEE